MTLLPEIGVWLIFAFWLLYTGWTVAGARRIRHLRDTPPAEPAPGRPLPRLAVIVPALNEEAKVRAALESLAALDYPGLIVVPINDRSTDRTGAIMDEVAAAANHARGDAAPRLCPIHVRDLPPRWLGKNHANWLGWREAKRQGAEWFLFTDGDVQFSPSSLRRAVAYMLERDLHHLAVAPELVLHSFGETILVSTFMIWFLARFQPWYVEDPRSKGFIGIGAFNLVRGSAYEALGTHEKLALTVADDVALGKLVKTGGFRQGFLEAQGEVKVEWQSSLGATVRGLYKNAFASIDFSVAKAAGTVATFLALNVLPYVLPFVTAGRARLAACGALACLMTVAARAARKLQQGWPTAAGVAVLSWFGGALMAWIVAASTAVTLRQGGVLWRGTLYPMRLLRDGQVRV